MGGNVQTMDTDLVKIAQFRLKQRRSLMKRFQAVCFVIAIMVFVAPGFLGTQASAEYYMGLAGNYASANLNGKFDPDNSVGINFRAGTQYRDWFAVELNLDYLPEFKDDGEIEVENVEIDADFDMEVLSFIFDAKFMPTLGTSSLRPILFAGFGWMVATADSSRPTREYLNSRSLDGSDFCWNFGLGLDYRISEIYSFDFKGTYVKGLGEVSDVEYLTLSLGVSYHF
jgi:Outer membrane protein beta-barrel domain